MFNYDEANDVQGIKPLFVQCISEVVVHVFQVFNKYVVNMLKIKSLTQ
jgi:hypothetical protein